MKLIRNTLEKYNLLPCTWKKPINVYNPPIDISYGTDVLFILKRRDNYGITDYTLSQATGLWNSASFVVDTLREQGWRTEIEMVIDNNCIDRIVTKWKPKTVIIEALWVVPEKFEILTKLHPRINWIVRLHSEMPFMAQEGIAFKWFYGYMKYPQVKLGINAPRMMREVRDYLDSAGVENIDDRLIYMPNTYPTKFEPRLWIADSDVVDIGCFGAIRPLKNHAMQAIAAVKFADEIGRKLRFHINATRIEMKGDPVLNNLRGMFDALKDKGHRLVEHGWEPREDFLKICAQMDIGMQVSFSETFNIVAADLTSQGVPTIGSKEIPWLSEFAAADPTDSIDIKNALHDAWTYDYKMVKSNQAGIEKYVKISDQVWYDYLISL